MKVHVLTLSPELFGGPLAVGVLKRAREQGALSVSLHRLRDHAPGPHQQVDDAPFGGGQGMVLKPEPLVDAIEHASAVDRPHRILLAAQGTPLGHARVRALAAMPSLLLVCGRYEGVDERVKGSIDEELSIGDYVLSGGEIAALVVLDAIARLLPGVLGNAASPLDESHATGLLEHPQYTRPAVFRDQPVPPVLLSGDHAAIGRWRREESLRLTAERRPDLLARAPLTAADHAFLARIGRAVRGGGG